MSKWKDYQDRQPATAVAEDAPVITLVAHEVDQLSRYLGVNVRNEQDLINAVKSVTTMRIVGAEVTFEPRLLQRLQSRCLDKGNFPRWLRERVIEWAHGYVGW